MNQLGELTLRGRWSAVYQAPNGQVRDFGVVSEKCVTTVFVNLLVDALQAAQSTFATFKWHQSGTGTADEAASDTDLGAPLAGGRTEGGQTEGATANIYQSVATIAYTGAATITEVGLFNAATGGVLLDRGKFAGIAVVNNSQIRFTYELTATAGGA